MMNFTGAPESDAGAYMTAMAAVPTLCIPLWMGLMLLFVAPASLAFAQESEREIESQDLRVGGNDKQRYFLIEAKNAPAGGWSGAGGCPPRRRRQRRTSVLSSNGSRSTALPDGYLVAQPVAVQWTKKQPITWPTAGDRQAIEGMKFTTEEFVAAVIQDMAARHKLDPQKIYTLSWSSGGPAAYAISLSSKQVVGSLVAMSVFKPRGLPNLDAAREQAYYLYHSPEDRVCPFRMAEQAVKELTEHGAKAKLTRYEGGHGWRPETAFGEIRAGVEWLEKNGVAEPAGRKVAPAAPSEAKATKDDAAKASAVANVAPRKQPAENKLSEIDGRWKLLSRRTMARRPPPRRFNGKTSRSPSPMACFGCGYIDRKPRKVEFSFRLDPTTNPKQIDLWQGPAGPFAGDLQARRGPADDMLLRWIDQRDRAGRPAIDRIRIESGICQ